MRFFILISAILAGLWLIACKTTPTPSAPAPQKPETHETAPAGRSTSSEPTESAQPGAQEKVKTRQTTSSDAAGKQSKDTKEKSQTAQTGSSAATEARSTETAQDSGARQASISPTAKSKLEKARDDLRISQATEKRIASELERLKKSGDASAEDVRNYETYLDRVRAMVAENRKIVDKMEAAYARHSQAKEVSKAPASGERQELTDPKIPEEQTQDRVAELDRQLSASLSEFDSMLLKEMETIETASTAKMHDLAQEAADAARRLKEKGVELDTGGSESSEEGSQQDEQGKTEQKSKAVDKDATGKEKGPDTQQGTDDDTVASSNTSEGGGSGPRRDAGSRYSKEDDDIVARQLREAAENETDPELKEKLWKEYEAYKQNTQ